MEITPVTEEDINLIMSGEKYMSLFGKGGRTYIFFITFISMYKLQTSTLNNFIFN